VLPEVQRLEGVGKAQLFAAGRAMRIWVDPIKLQGYGLPIASVNAAIAAQNQQISGGALGDTPNVPGTTMSASIVVPGQLTTPEQFGNVVLRSNADGSTVRIKDVARRGAGHRVLCLQLAPGRQACRRHGGAADLHRQRHGHGQAGL
jgi:multidrug efflux pump